MPQFRSDERAVDLAGPAQGENARFILRLPRLFELALRGLAWGNVRCRSCSELVFQSENIAPEQAGPTLCAACAALLTARRAGYCSLCGGLFPNADLQPAPCADCLRQAPPWSGVYFFAGYEQLVQSLFVGFKFHSDLAAGRLLAKLLSLSVGPALARDLTATAKNSPPALLVPVPVHKKRLQQRGFNQSFLLAKPLAKALHLPLVPQALRRTRLDPPQSSLGRKERLSGPRGAFAAHPLVNGHEIVLVDDVMTTGATLREATRILLGAGAARVRIVVLARTPSAAGTL